MYIYGERHIYIYKVRYQGITQKSCVALFPLWSLKKNLDIFWWG